MLAGTTRGSEAPSAWSNSGSGRDERGGGAEDDEERARWAPCEEGRGGGEREAKDF